MNIETTAAAGQQIAAKSLNTAAEAEIITYEYLLSLLKGVSKSISDWYKQFKKNAQEQSILTDERINQELEEVGTALELYQGQMPEPFDAKATTLALRDANLSWLKEFGNRLAIIKVDNARCFGFQYEMAKTNLPFTLLPVNKGDNASYYLVRGKDLSRIKQEIFPCFDQSLSLTRDAAMSLFKNQMVFSIKHMTLEQADFLQRGLAKNGFESRIQQDDSLDFSLVISSNGLSKEKLNSITNVIAMTYGHNINLLSGKIKEYDKSMEKVYHLIDDIGTDKNLSGNIIYDAAHPENYIEFTKNGVRVIQNNDKEHPMDQFTYSEEGSLKITDYVSFFAYPQTLNGDIESFSKEELEKPFVERSLLMTAIASQDLKMEQSHMIEMTEDKMHNLIPKALEPCTLPADAATGTSLDSFKQYKKMLGERHFQDLVTATLSASNLNKDLLQETLYESGIAVEHDIYIGETARALDDYTQELEEVLDAPEIADDNPRLAHHMQQNKTNTIEIADAFENSFEENDFDNEVENELTEDDFEREPFDDDLNESSFY
ncbi:hypothetical protein SAMN05216391_10930 [Lachnospiraceae bacterium KHCPX20]|nr:hypothetical protein SAMN05216391_10930 [Lachnospiraceae bacterium KHCPX20]